MRHVTPGSRSPDYPAARTPARAAPHAATPVAAVVGANEEGARADRAEALLKACLGEKEVLISDVRRSHAAMETMETTTTQTMAVKDKLITEQIARITALTQENAELKASRREPIE